MQLYKEQADIDNPTLITEYLRKDGVTIPCDERNKHYRKVLKWLGEGNVPTPAFTEEELSNHTHYKNYQWATQYLLDTNWYVMRTMETGEDIPAEIAEMRSTARDYMLQYNTRSNNG